MHYLDFNLIETPIQKTQRASRKTARAVPRSVRPSRGLRLLPPAPGRKWLFRLVALVVIPFVLLGGTEVGLRLADYGYDPGLFKKITIDGEQFYVNNETFGLRFFPPQLTRGLGPIRMPVQKPAGTYRIFILGESAAMGDPEPAYGAGRYLEALLSARYPQTHFEIVNLGITAINSHVILPIARDCAKAGGDLWIIYMGNNEMVGPFGAATVFGAKTPPLALDPARTWPIRHEDADWASCWRTVGPETQRRWKMRMRRHGAAWKCSSENQASGDDRSAAKNTFIKTFRENLRDIVKAGLDSGAKILLNTVAVNLKDCAPFASLVNSNLPPADRAQFEQFYTGGVHAEDRGNFAEAARQFELAARIYPTEAGLQFRWGESLLQLTNLRRRPRTFAVGVR